MTNVTDWVGAEIKRLNERRSELLQELSMIDQVLAIYQPSISSKVEPQVPQAPSIQDQKSKKFTNISMRWACLYLLSQADPQGLSTADIAEQIRQGGKSSQAYSFISTVSSVLSNMMRVRNEVKQVGNEWTLTVDGKSAWEHIEARAVALMNQQSLL